MKKLLVLLIAMVAMVVLPSFAQEVNMSRYITLTVKSGKVIKLNFKATQANTPVRIVSGGNTKNIIVNNTWYTDNNPYFTVTADGTTITIYGELDGIDCPSNFKNLTSLDVSKNPQLTELFCSDNELTSLDVSKNPQLTELRCFSNELTYLDVSKNPQLTTLDCFYNELTYLDVSKNPQLTYLYCNNNQLTSLDVSKNTRLKILYCYGNKFTTESMNELYCSLPDRQGRQEGTIYPLYKKDDANHETIAAATSDNARNKNWDVKYCEWNIRELDVPSKGNYQCK